MCGHREDGDDMIELARRELLRLGIGMTAWALTGCSTPELAREPLSYARWLRDRKTPYYIAHRGAGTTVPEHSLAAYQQALAWGAEAMELSVVMSKDGVLYCHHDLELDRTTTLTGATSDAAAAELDAGRIRIPRLGPAWLDSRMPAIPRLSAVLDAVGNKAVLCVEAKDDRAYEPMMAMLTERGLLPTAMAKINYASRRVEQAREAGLPVFAYLGNLEVATVANVEALAARLNPETDAIVLPMGTIANGIDDSVVRAAAATGFQVWMFPVHRRSEVARLTELGATGMITPALGYLTGREPIRLRDRFDEGKLAAGMTTRDPYSDWDALGWGTEGAIELTHSGERFVCLGDLAPITAGAYRVDLEVQLVSGEMKDTDAFAFAFGCPDDRYFGMGSGYQATLRHDGMLRIWSRNAEGDLVKLGEAVPSARIRSQAWRRLSIEVDPGTVSWGTDGTRAVVVDDTWRGGYLHVGRTSGSARLAVRRVNVR